MKSLQSVVGDRPHVELGSNFEPDAGKVGHEGGSDESDPVVSNPFVGAALTRSTRTMHQVLRYGSCCAYVFFITVPRKY